MLDFLRIKNLALIDDLELEFAPGLNVLTGETGAGKSFILKAVNFLTGEKLGPELVRPGAGKAVVEAVFRQPGQPEADGAELVLRRELSADTGRSRLYVDDALSSLETVQALRPRLVLHVGQHGQQRLLSPAYQARLVDAFLEDQDLPARRDAALAAARDAAAARRQLAERVRQLADKREWLAFQRQEIAKVNPRPGEEDELLARREAQRGLEAGRKARTEALGLLAGETGMAALAGRLARLLANLTQVDPALDDDRQAMAALALDMAELERRLRGLSLDAGQDVEGMEARLYALAQLRRKLGRSLEEIVGLAAEIDANLSLLDSAGLDDRQLARQEAQAAEQLAAALQELAAARRAAAGRFAQAMAAELRGLGFSEHLRLAVEFEDREVFPGLTEPVARILWQPNPGQPPQPLDRIASGGELSRFLLAVSRIMTREEKPTLIFDEIDAGIGGQTLVAVAQRLEELAAAQQLLVITHWPVLAARAGRHFRVAKEVLHGATFTRCQRLDPDQVRAELARMAGEDPQGLRLPLG